MESFAYWSDKPFYPRRISKPGRRRSRFVTIRYTGSFGRSAIKALVVIAFLAIMSSVIGERTVQNLDANKVASSVVSARIRR